MKINKKVTSLEKYCRGCKTTHDVSEFGVLSNTRDGLNTKCRQWRNEASSYQRITSYVQSNPSSSSVDISRALGMKILYVLRYVKMMKEDGIIKVDKNMIVMSSN